MEYNINLKKGPGFTLEQMYEKFGAEMGERVRLEIENFKKSLEEGKKYKLDEGPGLFEFLEGGERLAFEIDPVWWDEPSEIDPLESRLKALILKLSDKYVAMSEEELADVTPFDVLNEIYKIF